MLIVILVNRDGKIQFWGLFICKNVLKSTPLIRFWLQIALRSLSIQCLDFSSVIVFFCCVLHKFRGTNPVIGLDSFER